MSKQFVQGDVLFEKTGRKIGGNRVPARADGRIVIARGEKTGHDHTVDSETATLYQNGDKLALVVAESTQIVHQQHSPLLLEPGYYDVMVQRQYAPLAPKREIQYWD